MNLDKRYRGTQSGVARACGAWGWGVSQGKYNYFGGRGVFLLLSLWVGNICLCWAERGNNLKVSLGSESFSLATILGAQRKM